MQRTPFKLGFGVTLPRSEAPLSHMKRFLWAVSAPHLELPVEAAMELDCGLTYGEIHLLSSFRFSERPLEDVKNTVKLVFTSLRYLTPGVSWRTPARVAIQGVESRALANEIAAFARCYLDRFAEFRGVIVTVEEPRKFLFSRTFLGLCSCARDEHEIVRL